MAQGSWAELRAAVGNREWRALYAGALLSQMGDQLARVALALAIYNRTGSSAESALTFALSFVPYLFGSALTDIGDRRPRRQVMLACDLVRVGLAAAIALPGLGTAPMLGLYFLLGLAEPPFEAARAALAAEILGPKAYAAGHGLQQASFALVGSVGVLVAGALVAISGTSVALLANAATFGLSALFVFVGVQSGRVAAAASARVSVAGGFQVIRRSRVLRAVLLLAAGGALLTVPVDVLAAPIAHGAGHGALAASLLLAAPLAGTIVSSVLVTRIPPDARDQAMGLLAVGSFVPLALFVAQPGFVFVCLFALMTGLCCGYQVLANQRFMLSIDEADRSKAFGAASATIMAGQGLASALAGVLADYVEPERVVGVAGIGALAVAVAARRSLRRELPRGPEHTQGLGVLVSTAS
jgi:MFS family permease